MLETHADRNIWWESRYMVGGEEKDGVMEYWSDGQKLECGKID